MRLSEFIVSNREPILAEWEEFARTCTPAAGTMDITALRDHADLMLTVMVEDLETPQGKAEQAEKAKGQALEHDPAVATAAELHGADRAEGGFTVEQMVSEYRALRASVIRLWTEAKGEITPEDVQDLTRFNEAIDQALAESVQRFTEDLEQSKEMFLAILGHDLRTPLGAIFTSAKFMLETEELEEPFSTLMERIASSSTRMVHMVGDLLDFTRSRLGAGIPIKRTEAGMGKLVHDAVDEVRTVYPDQSIEIETRADQKGEWDPARISQMLVNLIGNAAEHSPAETPITIEIGEGEGAITLAIHNRGPVIHPERMAGIFNPMKAATAGGSASGGPTGNLGLGLYIAERIVNAHDGRIDVESSEAEGTTFTVHLPISA